MSFLSDMINRAKGLFAGPPVPQATDAIKHDRFDSAIYDELLEDAPALADLVDHLGGKYDYAEDMVRDVLMQFWQSDPLLRDQTEMDPRYLQNHGVARNVKDSPETAQTRSFTQHDKYGAAMATIAVTQKVKDFLENNEELQETLEQAKQAAEQREISTGLAKSKADDAAAAMNDYDGEGPLTEHQQQAQDDLAQAVQDAEDAAAQAEAAAQAMLEAAQQAKQSTKAAVNQAIKEAGEQLEEEAQLFRSWGVEDGVVKKLSFKERAALAQRLRSNRLNKFRELIGRFRTMAAAQRSRKVEYGRDEVVGVEMSDRIPDFLGQEYANLANKHLRLDFLSRMAEGQILSKKYQGIEKVGQGSIICLVDCSGSMEETDKHGISREAWAKAMALALLDQARAARRDFVGINFSSEHQQKVYSFPYGDMQDTAKLLEFCEHFFAGGTNFMKPMDLATDILERDYNDSRKPKGDIVFITDDDCGVTPAWMQRFQARKSKLDFRVFGISIGVNTRAGGALEAISDNVRSVTEFADPASVADVMRVV